MPGDRSLFGLSCLEIGNEEEILCKKGGATLLDAKVLLLVRRGAGWDASAVMDKYET